MDILLFALGIATGGGLALFVVHQQRVPPPVIPPCRFEACPPPPPVIIPEVPPVLVDAFSVPKLQPDEQWDVVVLHSDAGESERRVVAPAPTMLFRQHGRLRQVKYVRQYQDDAGRWHFTVEVPNGQ